MLMRENTVLIVIDVQGRLAQQMHERGDLLENLQKVIKGVKALGIPILWAEQNPDGLGPTLPEVAGLLSETQPIRKLSFSCLGNDRFAQELRALDRRQVLIAGIEAHVCVYQTSVDLLDMGYEVQIVADAVSSRTAANKRIALERVRDAGATVTSTETALFELLRVAKGPEFREILQIVK